LRGDRHHWGKGAFERFDSTFDGMGPTIAGIADRVEALLSGRRRAWRMMRLGIRYSASPWTYWRSRSQGAWHHGNDDLHPGLLARHGTAIPPWLHTHTWSFCLDGDEIAVNHRGPIGVLRSGTHTLYEHKC